MDRRDPEAVAALLEAAREWLVARGLDRFRGPVNPSTNHDCGLLVQGFRHPPTFLTPWNPRGCGELLEEAGLEPARDLLAYWIPVSQAAGFVLILPDLNHIPKGPRTSIPTSTPSRSAPPPGYGSGGSGRSWWGRTTIWV